MRNSPIYIYIEKKRRGYMLINPSVHSFLCIRITTIGTNFSVLAFAAIDPNFRYCTELKV